MVILYRDLYYNISSYLYDIDIVRSLDLLEHSSTNLTRNREQFKDTVKQPRDERFVYACSKGYLEVAQYYYDESKKQEAFAESCDKGYLNVSQWLYSLGGVNIHIREDHAFRYSCYNGHIDVAQWLYSLGGVDIHADYEFAFRWSYEYGHLDVYEWLKSLP